ncbi:MAG: T9SS type A sorting domain-containing protein [Bacteroidales bacterium]|nr:T9SS type A sorting domain-containing protein [Bacteroidales bacterium]
MKTIFTLFLSAILCQNMFGQEFSFSIVFEDAIGNKDTLVLGYDANATDTIDEEFGEINIIGIPLDSLFDVRVSDAFWKNGIGTFQTKKQIVPANSCTGPSLITIDFKCVNWPVTASWDNSVFDDTCREGSVFTSVHPGGWWDTGSPSDLWRAELKNENEVTFTSNVIPGAFNENYAYINQVSDTIPVFWLAFGKAGLLWMDVDEIDQEKSLAIFPNPNDGSFFVDNRFSEKGALRIFTLKGGEVESLHIDANTLQFISTDLPAGMYMAVLELPHQRLSAKFVVQHP